MAGWKIQARVRWGPILRPAKWFAILECRLVDGCGRLVMPVVRRGVDDTDNLERMALAAVMDEAHDRLDSHEIHMALTSTVERRGLFFVPGRALVASVILALLTLFAFGVVALCGCGTGGEVTGARVARVEREFSEAEVRDWVSSARIATNENAARMFDAANASRLREAIPKAIIYAAKESPSEARRSARDLLASWSDEEIHAAVEEFASDQFPALMVTMKALREAR